MQWRPSWKLSADHKVCVMMYSVQVNGLHFVILARGVSAQYEKLCSRVKSVTWRTGTCFVKKKKKNLRFCNQFLKSCK